MEKMKPFSTDAVHLDKTRPHEDVQMFGHGLTADGQGLRQLRYRQGAVRP